MKTNKINCQSYDLNYPSGNVKCSVPNCCHNRYKTAASQMCSCCASIAFHEIGKYGFKAPNQTLFEKVAEYRKNTGQTENETLPID